MQARAPDSGEQLSNGEQLSDVSSHLMLASAVLSEGERGAGNSGAEASSGTYGPHGVPDDEGNIVEVFEVASI